MVPTRLPNEVIQSEALPMSSNACPSLQTCALSPLQTPMVQSAPRLPQIPRSSSKRPSRDFETQSIMTQHPGSPNMMPRPSKRVRFLSPPSGPDTSTLPTHTPPLSNRSRRHPQFWVPDGNVVLDIQGTLFRLHKSRLAQHSTYFSDLFRVENDAHFGQVKPEVGAAAKREEISEIVIQGCPVFRLENISPVDFGDLLTALDNAIQFLYTPPSFSILSGILKASKSLGFTTLNGFATRALEGLFPTSLDEFCSTLTQVPIANCVEGFNLAKEYGLSGILKRSSYELLRSHTFTQDTPTPDDREVISRPDLLSLVKIRSLLQEQWVALIHSPRFLTTCPLADPCVSLTDSREFWRVNVLESQIMLLGLHDPIHAICQIVSLDWDGGGYCSSCVEVTRGRWNTNKSEIWKKIGGWVEEGFG